MATTELILPDPKLEIQFSIDELDWLFNNPSWTTTLGPITHPKTGQVKYIKITVEAQDTP